MFICERAKVEYEHCAKWDRAFQQGIARKAGRPRFLAHAWGWVEFRRIAVQRQWHYLIDSSDADASEPPADKQFGLIL
jgi:hypothetical protein